MLSTGRIGWTHARHCPFLNSHVFRRHTKTCTSRQLHLFTLSFDWFIGLSMTFVIRQSNILKTLVLKRLLMVNRSIEYKSVLSRFRNPSQDLEANSHTLHI